MHLVGFIIRIHHDARSAERQNTLKMLSLLPKLLHTSTLSVVSIAPTFLSITKLRAATMYVVMSVCLSVCPTVWNNSAASGRIFTKFDICTFLKTCQELPVLHMKTNVHL